jgi:hypothetical protein
MKDKNGRQGAGRRKEVALPGPREDSPLRLSQAEIARLHKLDTFSGKRLPEIFRGVDEASDFDRLTLAAKGAAPSPRLRFGVHIRKEDFRAWPRHSRQFARQRSRPREVTDGKGAHDNISHLGTKRKRQAIAQDEALLKHRLRGRTDYHRRAEIHPHDRACPVGKEFPQPAACSAANVEAAPTP